MKKALFHFEVTENLFEPGTFNLKCIVPDYPHLCCTVPTRHPQQTVLFKSREIIREVMILLYNARKSMLDHTGSTLESYLIAVDKLRPALKTIGHISDNVSFVSYANEMIMPKLEMLTPRPGTVRQYNYTMRLNQLKRHLVKLTESITIYNNLLQIV